MVTSTQEEESKSSGNENNNRLWKIPGIQSAWYYTTITYNTIKDSNSTIWAVNSVKQAAQKTWEQIPATEPVLNTLVKPIILADRSLWDGLAAIKAYVPNLTEPSWKIYQTIDPLQTINIAKEFGTQKAKDFYNFSLENANNIPNLCYTLYRPISSNIGHIVVHDIIPMLSNGQMNDIWPILTTRYIQSAVGNLDKNKKIIPKLELNFVFVPIPGIQMKAYFSISCDI